MSIWETFEIGKYSCFITEYEYDAVTGVAFTVQVCRTTINIPPIPEPQSLSVRVKGTDPDEMLQAVVEILTSGLPQDAESNG